MNNIELCLQQYAPLQLIESIQSSSINKNVCCVEIKSDQDPVVMDVLFSLLSDSGNVHSFDIYSLNLSQRMEHIKKIGPCLREISISDVNPQLTMIKTITI